MDWSLGSTQWMLSERLLLPGRTAKLGKGGRDPAERSQAHLSPSSPCPPGTGSSTRSCPTLPHLSFLLNSCNRTRRLVLSLRHFVGEKTEAQP